MQFTGEVQGLVIKSDPETIRDMGVKYQELEELAQQKNARQAAARHRFEQSEHMRDLLNRQKRRVGT